MKVARNVPLGASSSASVDEGIAPSTRQMQATKRECFTTGSGQLAVSN
jgi:hypothetical protein